MVLFDCEVVDWLFLAVCGCLCAHLLIRVIRGVFANLLGMFFLGLLSFVCFFSVRLSVSCSARICVGWCVLGHVFGRSSVCRCGC